MKAFASPVFSALAAAVLAAAAATVLFQEASHENNLAAWQALKASDAIADAIPFLNSSVDDALLDAGWAAFAPGNSGSFQDDAKTLEDAYFNKALEKLAEGSNVVAEEEALEITELPETIPADEYLKEVVVSHSFTLTASLPKARKTKKVEATRYIRFYNATGFQASFSTAAGQPPYLQVKTA